MKNLADLINFIHKHEIMIFRDKSGTYACVEYEELPEFIRLLGHDCDADGGFYSEILTGGAIVVELTETFCEWHGIDDDVFDGVIELYER